MLVYTIPQLDIIHNSSAHLLQLQKIFSKYDAGDELLDLNNNDNFNNIPKQRSENFFNFLFRCRSCVWFFVLCYLAWFYFVVVCLDAFVWKTFY